MLISSAVIGLIVGFFASMPVGPVNMALISATIRIGFRHGFSVAMGAAVMDAVYMFLALLGISLLSFNQNLVFAIQLGGILLLTVLGFKELLVKPDKFELRNSSEYLPRKRRFFALGLLFYVSNPGILVFFAGLASWLKVQHLMPSGMTSYIIASVAVGVGTTIWFLLLIRVILHYKEKFSMRLLLKINRISGVLLILFAGYMAVMLIRDPFPEKKTGIEKTESSEKVGTAEIKNPR